MKKQDLIKLLNSIPGNPEIMLLSKPTIYTGLDKAMVIDLPYKKDQAVLLKPLGVSISDSIKHV